jgi:hypothetical protein
MWTAVAQNKTSWERKNPTPPRLVFNHRCPNRQLTGSKMAFFTVYLSDRCTVLNMKQKRVDLFIEAVSRDLGIFYGYTRT